MNILTSCIISIFLEFIPHIILYNVELIKDYIELLQSINKRFQRLESHVVTLARSVAHLSSEMRTQHLMIQVRESLVNI